MTKRTLDPAVKPDEATDLYDVKRLAALLRVRPATVRSMRTRDQLPEPTSTDINGGAVWAREIVDSFFASDDDAGTKVSVNVNPTLPKVIDLFSGCGGMSLGFQLAGFDVLEGFDNWQCAVDTYSKNLGHSATMLDLGDLDATIGALEKYEGVGEFPAIIGGPPCQDFSSAGSRIEGARADLTEKFASVIVRFTPPFFVMENVARAERAAAFKRAVAVMEEAGYTVKKVVLDASLCGVPQKRKRLITIGSKNPAVTAAIFEWLAANQSEKPMTVREWFGNRLNTDTYYRHPRSYARRGVFSIDEPSPTVRGVNRPVPAGYPGHPGDVVAVDKTRPLTAAERAEIQTFPPGYKWVASRTNTEQMIGNAVPVRLAKFVAQGISASLASEGGPHGS
ncbi:DNA cytosine methyltransferase [Mycetocola sp. JXN-3]|uniref:DNA cytosine methyltransferase n=1 Tax=Mycetocola sp. JXN-3 TaxID=2116510 RepID=UPI00165D05FE|nr:DNA (cytosine-5-)-methyltransferase [Mycetocola sp. JXN-3]